MEKRSCFWRHSWDNWQKKGEFDITRGKEEDVVGRMILQERNCQNCGYVQVDKQTIYI